MKKNSLISICFAFILTACSSSSSSVSNIELSSETSSSKLVESSSASLSLPDASYTSEAIDGYIVYSHYSYSTTKQLQNGCKAFQEHAPYYFVLENEGSTLENSFILHGFDNVRYQTVHLSVDHVSGDFGPMTVEGKISALVHYETYGCVDPTRLEKVQKSALVIEFYEGDLLVASVTKGSSYHEEISFSDFVEMHSSFLSIDE